MNQPLWTRRQLCAEIGAESLRGRVRSGSVVRLVRAVYAAQAPTVDDHLRAVLLRAPEHALLTLHTAAGLFGMYAPTTGVVHVLVPPGSPKPRIPGVQIHEGVLGAGQAHLVRGLPCVSPERCAIDLGRSLSRSDAVGVLDSAVRLDGVTQECLTLEALRHRGLRGVRQVRDLLPLIDGGAECAQESQLRLLLVDGGLPRPESQIRVCDEGGVVRYRLDMGYREQRVGVEYDGSSHLDLRALAHDRARSNFLAMQGWKMRHFTAYDIYRRPGYVVSTVRAALGG
ncbi:DUF559 domain-containing protein [Mangrovihabitans endophyticus]|uniref:DUF559 domain-containing protein n=1 Tax=Mangrovihabitans endophyticus TaxID=1751298 RepID=UPI001667CFE7|nr:DUF559 domain-containing protein [Mangrovihabitans endophyticus]